MNPPTSFEPFSAIAGGLLIGLASAVLLLANGRVAGISGIVGRSVFASAGDLGWRLCFLIGLPIGAGLVAIRQGGLTVEFDASRSELIVAGLLVGIGTQLGNGCTSGHGVCGIARGSRRSIAATATFMVTAAGVVFLVRHVFGSTT